MNFLRPIFRHAILPAFESGWKRRRTFRYWDELERSQWLSSEELRRLQHLRLQALLTCAHEHSEYYRQEWTKLGLHPRTLASLDDLGRWPLIDRETVRKHRSAMRTGRRVISKSTGGSTGEPLHFDLDLDSHDRRTAAWHRGYSWAGAGPGTKQLYLWGTRLDGTRASRLKDRLYHALHRRHVMSCFDMPRDFAIRFAAELERRKPDAIVAYVNPLYAVARDLDSSGRSLRHRPRSIVVGAEKLHPFQRECIERVFGAPVFETYGSREFMLIGAECDRHSGLHLSAEHLIVEIVDDRGRPASPGHEGEIVVTDLTNLGMPFIRYRTGDRAIAGFDTCPCGRTLPLLRTVVGRQLDIIRTPDGRALPGEFFPHLMKDFAEVRRFQVVQESPTSLHIRLVAPNLTPEARQKLEQRIRDATGPTLIVRFEPVNDIPLTGAGKLRLVVNTAGTREAA
ncbi:MAG: phenylacetate--CoA ligase family protein [Phycisphaeraceae bacterium]|nr:phenylacetate--CoA ligase family protein [Phycisphaeraceae bacterium]